MLPPLVAADGLVISFMPNILVDQSDVIGLDYISPFCDLGVHEGAEFGLGHRQGRGALLLPGILDVRTLEDGNDVLFSRSTIGCGVAFGAMKPTQSVAAKPGTPASAKVGTSGRIGERSVPPVASARSKPALMIGAIAGMASNRIWVCPFKILLRMSLESVSGKCRMSILVICLRSSAAIWELEP